MIRRLIAKTRRKTEADLTSVFHFLLKNKINDPDLCQVHKVPVHSVLLP